MGSFIGLTAKDGQTLRAYVAGAPEQPRGLVLCHGYAGLNRHVRRVADRMAALGFCVVAPALFDRAEPDLELGYTTSDRARGRAVAAHVPIAQTMLDVTAAAAALGHPAIAILGYEFGATMGWHAAARVPGFRAAVCFYGDFVADALLETPLCPTQLHFAEFDDHVSSANLEAIRHAQPEVAIEFYRGAARGFACDEQESFNPGAAETAHDNTLTFLRRHMNNAPRARPVVPATKETVAVAPLQADSPRRPHHQLAFGRRAFA